MIQGHIDDVVNRLVFVCIKRLDELLKQKVINEKEDYQMHIDDVVKKLSGKRFQVSKVVDGEMMIDRRTCEALGPEVDYILCKYKF